MFKLLKKFITFCVFFVSISEGNLNEPNNIAQNNNTLIQQISDLKNKLSSIEQTINKNNTDTNNKTKTPDIKQKIITNIKTQVKFSWRSLKEVKKYIEAIYKTYTMINTNINIKKAFYTDLLLQIFFIISSIIISWILIKAIKIQNYTTKQSLIALLSIINFEILLSVSNTNKKLSYITTIIFCTFIMNKLIKLYKNAIIKYYYAKRKNIFDEICQLINRSIYISSIIYCGFLFSSIIKVNNSGFIGMLQIQSLSLSFLFIIFILSNKNSINQLIFKTNTSFKNPFIKNILLMWHWLLVLIIVLLITTWTIKTTTLNILMNTIFTIITIPAFSLLNRFIYGFVLLYIRKHQFKNKTLLLDWYKVLKKYIFFASIITQTILLLYIWNINLMNILLRIFTQIVIEKLIIIIFIIYIFKIAQFFIDYLFIIKPRNQREQINKLFRMFCNILLFIINALIFIQILGYDPWPAISSLGFISLGLSVGAQAIIKDVFSGFLLVLDNTIALGDTIIIDDQQGVVEELSLCTLKMRLENGTLMTLQYGELKKLGNKSKKYCYAILNTSISYTSDPEEAIKLIEQAYKNIKQTSAGNKILSPIDIRGIEKISGYEIIIQSRIQTIPRAESSVTRMFNLQIKKLFDQAGIKMPDPRLLLNKTE